MHHPPNSLSLRAEAGEALMARVHQSGLSEEDAGVVEQVIRMSFWVVFGLREAQLSLKRLRTWRFGKGPKPPKPVTPDESSASPQTVGEGASAATVPSRDEALSGVEGSESKAGAGASGTALPPKPRGGHHPGTGRLGADVYEGAKRVECRHAE